jgi:hypothetical protein
MLAFDHHRMSRLFRERAQLSEALRQAEIAASSLTLEHNRLIRRAGEAVTDGARQRAGELAGRKGEELKKARARVEELSKSFQQKEVEMADMIAALWAASQSLFSDDTMRQLNDDIGETNRRLQHIDERIGSIPLALETLVTAIEGQAGFLRSTGNNIGAVMSAADSTAAALTQILRDLRQQSRALQAIIGNPAQRDTPVVQMGWRPGTPAEASPRSPQLPPEALSSLPEQVAVLLFASEPRDLPRPDLDREIREILSKIHEAEFGDRINFHPWPAAEPLDLIPNMNRHKPHMIQFSGHGTADGLLMMGPRDRSVPLAADRLIQMLSWTGEDLRIVFFNICDSEEHARAAARVIDGAIGMRGKMHDGPAREFAAQLYSALAFGRSLKCAFHQACTAIGDEPDSSAPQLFFRNGSDPHKLVLVRPGDY